MRMLTPSLRGHRCDGSLKNLQQRLLHSLAGNIAGDRWVLRLARYFIDLINVDNAGLGLLDVEICCLDQLQENVLHVLTT